MTGTNILTPAETSFSQIKDFYFNPDNEKENSIFLKHNKHAEDFIKLVGKEGRLPDFIDDFSNGLQRDVISYPLLSSPQHEVGKMNVFSNRDVIIFTDSLQRQKDINNLQRTAEFHGNRFDSVVNDFYPDKPKIKISSPGIEPHDEITANSCVKRRSLHNDEVAKGASPVSGTGFKNLFGDLGMFSVSNLLVSMTNKLRTLFSKQSAASINNMVTSAERAGNYTINAAKQNLSGALVSGIVGSTVQLASGSAMFRTAKKELKVINTDLKNANIKETAVQINQSKIKEISDQLKSEGKAVNLQAEAKMARSHTKLLSEAQTSRNAHLNSQTKTQQCRAMTDTVNQVNQMGQHVIVAGYGAAAATETNQAELSKADQQIHHELSDTHKQKNKGTEDSTAAIIHSVESWYNINSNTVSSIADRTR